MFCYLLDNNKSYLGSIGKQLLELSCFFYNMEEFGKIKELRTPKIYGLIFAVIKISVSSKVHV